jgi:hypothetical protein
MRRAMASSPAQLQFLPRAVGNHRVSEREFRSTGLSVGTALTAAVAGGIQAGFYALCGGLALDWTGARNPVRALASSVITAIALWTIGCHYIGGAVGLPRTDMWSGFAPSLFAQ